MREKKGGGDVGAHRWLPKPWLQIWKASLEVELLSRANPRGREPSDSLRPCSNFRAFTWR